MDSFFLNALLGGIGVALMAGPFGSFVVWRRLAYFGDTLAHSAMLGIAVGFLLHVHTTMGIVLVGLLIAFLLHFMHGRNNLPGDTALGILSHASLSLGLVLIAFMSEVRVDLESYLFGDILAVSQNDIFWILGGGTLSLIILLFNWRSLLAITLHKDLARVEGIPVERMQLLFLSLMAIIVALMLKIVGLILVTSLFIIPAATARRITTTPEAMAAASSLIGAVAVACGLWASLTFDTPAGPSIVLSATVIFIVANLFPAKWFRILR